MYISTCTHIRTLVLALSYACTVTMELWAVFALSEWTLKSKTQHSPASVCVCVCVERCTYGVLIAGVIGQTAG